MIPQVIQLTSVCDTNEKDMALLQQIWSTFATVLWFSKTKITDGTGILVLVRVLWDMISKIYWQFWHSFFKNALESSYNFNPIEITWRKIKCSVCLTPVSMAVWGLHALWRFTVPACCSCELVYPLVHVPEQPMKLILHVWTPLVLCLSFQMTCSNIHIAVTANLKSYRLCTQLVKVYFQAPKLLTDG